MSPLMLFALLLLNFGISFWNAYACGAYLTESKIIGGWTRFVVWCGLIMSACGFTWVYVALLGMGAVAFEFLTPGQGQVVFELGYLVIIGPVLASGLGIWIHSLVTAYRERSFGSVAVAGWNTYAQFHNTWEAASHTPGIFRHVMDSLGGDSDSDSKNTAALLLIVLLVIVALAGGILTTMGIARWADRRVALDIAGIGHQPQRARA